MSSPPQSESIWSSRVPVGPISPESQQPAPIFEVVRAERELRAIDQLMADLTDEFLTKDGQSSPDAQA